MKKQNVTISKQISKQNIKTKYQNKTNQKQK